MKQPDRFARLVGQHRHIACDGMGYVLLEDTARHLLRLEHRRRQTSSSPYSIYRKAASMTDEQAIERFDESDWAGPLLPPETHVTTIPVPEEG